MKFFQDGNLLEIGGLTITLYATAILIGIILATIHGIKEFRRLGVAKQLVIDGVLICVPLAILGARFYYVILDMLNGSNSYDSFFDMINLTQGGLAITGGIIVSVIFVLIYSYKRKINAHKVFDVLAPSLLIGQAVGRWGNFFNQEAYGAETTRSFLSKFLPDFIVNKMYIDGTYYHPTFLYESLWNLLGLAIILITRRLKTKLQLGDYLAFYLIWYGFGRGFLIEPFRQDAQMIGDVRFTMVFAIGMCIAGIVYFIVKRIFFKQPYYHEELKKVKENRIKTVIIDTNDLVFNLDKVYDNAIYNVLGANFKYTYDDILNNKVKITYDEKDKIEKFVYNNYEDNIKFNYQVKPLLKQMRNTVNIVFITNYDQKLVFKILETLKLSQVVLVNEKDLIKSIFLSEEKNTLVVSQNEKLLTKINVYGYKLAYISNTNTMGKVDYNFKKITKIDSVI